MIFFKSLEKMKNIRRRERRESALWRTSGLGNGFERRALVGEKAKREGEEGGRKMKLSFRRSSIVERALFRTHLVVRGGTVERRKPCRSLSFVASNASEKDDLAAKADPETLEEAASSKAAEKGGVVGLGLAVQDKVGQFEAKVNEALFGGMSSLKWFFILVALLVASEFLNNLLADILIWY